MTKYLKALYGAAATGLGAVAVAYSDNVITNQEWVTVAIATVGALGVIWAVPNGSPTSKFQNNDTYLVAKPKEPAASAAPLPQAPPAPPPTT